MKWIIASADDFMAEHLLRAPKDLNNLLAKVVQ